MSHRQYNYGYSVEEVKKACQVLDQHLRVHSRQCLNLPYADDNHLNEHYTEPVYQCVASLIFQHEDVDVNWYKQANGIEIPVENIPPAEPIRCQVLYPFLEEYIRGRWNCGVEPLMVIPSPDDQQYLEYYDARDWESNLEQYSRICRVFDAETGESIYAFLSYTENPRTANKDLFRDGMGTSDLITIPDSLKLKLREGEPLSLDRFLGRGFFWDIQPGETIGKNFLNSLANGLDWDERVIKWKHQEVGKAVELASKVFPKFSHYYHEDYTKPIDAQAVHETEVERGIAVRISKAISKYIENGYGLEVMDSAYCLVKAENGLLQRISWKGDQDESGDVHYFIPKMVECEAERLEPDQSPQIFETGTEKITLEEWLERANKLPSKTLREELKPIVNWIENTNVTNLMRVWLSGYEHTLMICSLAQAEQSYKFKFFYHTSSGTNMEIKGTQKSSSVAISIPAIRAFPHRVHWKLLTDFCTEPSLIQEGFVVEKRNFEVNSKYLEDCHQRRQKYEESQKKSECKSRRQRMKRDYGLE